MDLYHICGSNVAHDGSEATLRESLSVLQLPLL